MQRFYHDAIHTRFAWDRLGGDGEGVQFLDMEQGWDFEHEDLLDANLDPDPRYGESERYVGHGTAVLGIVLATVNGRGGVGITPGVSGLVASHVLDDGTDNTHDAIMKVVHDDLHPGDVLLLEAQTTALMPRESEPAVFEAILCATLNHVIVVEAAANGGTDFGDEMFLPAFVSPEWEFPLDFDNSGAIMVGAGTLIEPYVPAANTNRGDRVDCFAPGAAIDTAGDGYLGGGHPDEYTEMGFSGTSAASPIVAAAAVSLQGIRLHEMPGAPILPEEMRQWLSDKTDDLNTPSNNPAVDRIGVMPNLQNLITHRLMVP
jgi:subtilisin family serine protease